MDNQNIETITNSLAEGYKQLVPGTFQEASQIQIQRRADRDLRNRWVYTANLPLFRMNGGDLEYGLGGRQAFDAIAGENIDEFVRQIHPNGGYYKLTTPQMEKLESLAADIVWAKAADLDLNKENSEWSYFLIDTQDTAADKLTPSQKSLAAKAHGSMEAKSFPEQKLSDYGETMEMLDKQGDIRQTRLWLPTPVHIDKYLTDGAVVARAAGLYGFGSDSNLDAYIREVVVHDGLRGVRRASLSEPAVPVVSPVGGGLKKTGSSSAPSKITCAEHYDALLTNPEGALSALNDKRAGGIAKLLADYLAAQAQ